MSVHMCFCEDNLVCMYNNINVWVYINVQYLHTCGVHTYGPLNVALEASGGPQASCSNSLSHVLLRQDLSLNPPKVKHRHYDLSSAYKAVLSVCQICLPLSILLLIMSLLPLLVTGPSAFGLAGPIFLQCLKSLFWTSNWPVSTISEVLLHLTITFREGPCAPVWFPQTVQQSSLPLPICVALL